MTDYDEAIEFHEAQLDVPLRRQSPEEMREYVIGQLAVEYVRCIEGGIRDERAWNRLSKWMYALTELQEAIRYE